MPALKQALVVREDLEMSRGKMIAQACHASLGAYRKASEDECSEWELQGAKKIVLSPGDLELEEVHQQAKMNGLPAYMVKDAGMTELEPGTATAVGIGPAEESKIDTVTGELALID
ncbi:MAG: peptidyl-tRNA hydrolase Pth2 [Candidatus Nanohaloarchaea archaeon]